MLKIDLLRAKYEKYGYPLMDDFNDVARAIDVYNEMSNDINYDWIKYRIGLFINTLKTYLSCGRINSATFNEIRNEMWSLIL